MTQDQFILNVKRGQGWTTDGYVDNFFDASGSDKYDVMIRLAKLGMLYDENKIDSEDEDSGNKPTSGKMTTADVTKIWKNRLLKGESLRRLISKLIKEELKKK